jgi:hypothetical protein
MRKNLSAATKVKGRRAALELVRPLVRNLSAYVPGEQPRIPGLIKLNTNENPYPPAPAVLATVRDAVDDRLRLYPNPTAQLLRDKLAKFHNCDAARILVGNGSDELLALATRAFVEPLSSTTSKGGVPVPRSTVQYFTPSYSLYPVLADIHGARSNPVPLRPDFSLPSIKVLRRSKVWDFRAALTYVTTPNAPSGRGYTTAELRTLCRAQAGVVLLDETYVDFADDNALPLALEGIGLGTSERPGGSHFFQGLFPLLPAGGVSGRPPGAHRRPGQDPRQLQRQWTRPNRGGRHPRSARLLSPQFPAHPPHPRARRRQAPAARL